MESESKQSVGAAEEGVLAGAAGFEPATLGFGDRCSTSLSYAPAMPDCSEEEQIGHRRNANCTMAEPLLYNLGCFLWTSQTKPSWNFLPPGQSHLRCQRLLNLVRFFQAGTAKYLLDNPDRSRYYLALC